MSRTFPTLPSFTCCLACQKSWLDCMASQLSGEQPSALERRSAMSGLIRLVLARIIHERFCCNRRSAATTSLRSAGSPFGPSTYCTSTPQVLRAPRAALATRLSDFATNRHEQCGRVRMRFRVEAATSSFPANSLPLRLLRSRETWIMNG